MGQMASSIGSAFKNPNTFAPSPSGFSGPEWIARLAGGAGKGALQGLSQQGQPRGDGGMAIQPTQVMPVDPSYFQPQSRGRNDLNFYGG